MEVYEGETETSFCWGRTMAGPPSNCSCVGALNTTGTLGSATEVWLSESSPVIQLSVSSQQREL